MLPGGEKTPGKVPGFVSFLSGAEEQHFLLLPLCPKDGKGRELLPRGCQGNEEVGMSWQSVCTSCYMSGTGLRADADMLKRKWAISSCPCHTICCVCTGCLVSYRSRPEIVGSGECESVEPYPQEGPGCSLFEWVSVMLWLPAGERTRAK